MNGGKSLNHYVFYFILVLIYRFVNSYKFHSVTFFYKILLSFCLNINLNFTVVPFFTVSCDGSLFFLSISDISRS